MRAAADAALELLAYYGSIHRGAGVVAAASAAAYERARAAVASFVGAGSDQTLVFVRNTTGALNLLAHCVPEARGSSRRGGEHNANMLPWRRREVGPLPFTQSADELLSRAADALSQALRPARHLRRRQRSRAHALISSYAAVAAHS